MRGILTAASLFVGVALTAGAADDKTEKFRSKDGKFAVQFPAGAKVGTKTQKAGELTMHVAHMEVKDRAYVVMYMDLPEAAKDAPAKLLLDGCEKGGIAESGGKLVNSKDIEFGAKKLPGRDLVIDKDGNKIKSRIIVAGVRVYLVIVGGPKDFATDKEGAAFLDSFEITK